MTVNKQTYFPGTEPPDVVQVVAIDDAITAWLDAQRERREANEDVRTTHAAMIALIEEHKLERYPYTDEDGKKKEIVVEIEKKAKSKRQAKAKEGDQPDDWTDDSESPPSDNGVESRRVPRESVEGETDPFAATRMAMDGASS